MDKIMSTEEKILARVKSSWRQLKLTERPAVGICVERKTITLNKYDTETKTLIFMEDLCKTKKVDLDVLKLILKENKIRYNL